MFYIWHTIIIAAFISGAYYLGWEHGKRQAENKETIRKS